MRFQHTLLFIFFSISIAMSQSKDLPYSEIPEYPESYTAGTVAARVIDGLGFRYYWATEGLTEADLAYKPSEEARTSEQTIDHILSLTLTIVNAAESKKNTFPDWGEYTFEQKRKMTLGNIRKASEIVLKGSDKDMENYRVIFDQSEYPFWNMLNGPISDALWHVGQVVTFRRSSGNPLPSGVSVLRGTRRE